MKPVILYTRDMLERIFKWGEPGTRKKKKPPEFPSDPESYIKTALCTGRAPGVTMDSGGGRQGLVISSCIPDSHVLGHRCL